MSNPIDAVEADPTRWGPWTPDEVHRRLAGVTAPWYVAGGWAIDLFLGGRRRAHDDLEIAVPRERFGEIAAELAGFDFFVPTEPGVLTPLAGAPELLDRSHQTWVREPSTELWRVDVFREPHDGETWIWRRDDRIRLPYAEVIERTPAGIPFARPEIALLFKAKAARPKDDADLAAVLPLLTEERRRRLVEAIGLAHPGHRWLADTSRPRSRLLA